MPHRPKILLIDDDELILRTCERVLRGHDLQTADNGAKALPLIQEQDFDVIVSDMYMPEMTGSELYSKVMQFSPSKAARMLFMTGDSAPHEDFLKQFPFYIKKPFDKNKFLEAVQHILNHGLLVRIPKKARGRVLKIRSYS